MNAERQASEMEMCRGGAGGCARVRGRGGRRRESLLTTRGKTRKKKRCDDDDEEELQSRKQIESLFLLKELPSSPECRPCGAEKQPSARRRRGPTTCSFGAAVQ